MVLSLHPQTFATPLSKIFAIPHSKICCHPPPPRNCFAILHPKGLFASPLLQFICHLNHQKYSNQPSPPKIFATPLPKYFATSPPRMLSLTPIQNFHVQHLIFVGENSIHVKLYFASHMKKLPKNLSEKVVLNQ